MPKCYDFSSESVGEGHPDKVADYISDSVLDACMAQDPDSRIACETMVKSNYVVVGGEVTSNAEINYEKVIRDAIREIGYIHDEDVFHAERIFFSNMMTLQSPDIAQGVDAEYYDGKDTCEQGAGDQGIMFGYACDETPELMPAAIMYAHKINQEIARMRHEQVVPWLRPDMKSQVALAYEDDQAIRANNIVISTQHTENVKHADVKAFCIEEVIKKIVPEHLLTKETEYFINPTGKFVIGGPQGDAGLTGRKIIVDTYGGAARHGGGAFSGKDPSKVDRSAAYMCRWVAKNIVAAGLAKRCELQVAYAIGYPDPTSIQVETFGTAQCPDSAIAKAVQDVFSFKPADITKQLDLLRPIYRETTNYGHFTKGHLPWEQTNKADELKAATEQQLTHA